MEGGLQWNLKKKKRKAGWHTASFRARWLSDIYYNRFGMCNGRHVAQSYKVGRLTAYQLIPCKHAMFLLYPVVC